MMRAPDLEEGFPVADAAKRYEASVKLFRVAERMKSFGVRIDRRAALLHRGEAEDRAYTFSRLFCHLTHLSRESLGESGAGQTDAVKAWFASAGAPPVVLDKRTKKPQFNAAALTIWAKDFPGARFSQPAAALLGLRKARTCHQFVTAYLKVSEANSGRIHFGFNPMGTKGERWSASQRFAWWEGGELQSFSLNAQNVPSKEVEFDFGPEGNLPLMVSLRDCFIPDPGCVWIKWDGDAAEARVQAAVTGDTTLQRWIDAGLDLHFENAKLVFPGKIPLGASWKKDSPFRAYRAAAKPLQYSLPYQYAQHNGKDRYPETFKAIKQAFPDFSETLFYRTVVKNFFEAHRNVPAWHMKTRREVERTGGFTLPQTGRKLYFPPTFRGFNQALNFQMQSGYGAVINRAIPLIDELMTWNPGGLALLLMVHDEVDCQVPEGKASEVEGQVADILGEPMDFGGTKAGIPALGAVGSNWKDGKDLR